MRRPRPRSWWVSRHSLELGIPTLIVLVGAALTGFFATYGDPGELSAAEVQAQAGRAAAIFAVVGATLALDFLLTLLVVIAGDGPGRTMAIITFSLFCAFAGVGLLELIAVGLLQLVSR
jgi:hypothetical protein